MWICIFRRVRWRASAVALLSLVIALTGGARAVFAQPAQPAQLPSSTAAQELLLDGVRAFRGERYEEALALFQRVAERGRSGDIGFYLGMTQHKLGRHLEALLALRAARRHGLREPVADYYQAVSCYRLGMLERARQMFAALSAPPEKPDPATGSAPILGPRLREGAQRFAQALDKAREAGDRRLALLQQHETARARAEVELAAGGPLGALEWFDEAVSSLAQVPQHEDKLPALRQGLLRLRAALHGQPAEAEIAALWSRVSGGAI
jgi:tetratricopeptide (TPR) repeat protein